MYVECRIFIFYENGAVGFIHLEARVVWYRIWTINISSSGHNSVPSAVPLKYAAHFSRKARHSVLSGVPSRPRVVKKEKNSRRYLVIQVKWIWCSEATSFQCSQPSQVSLVILFLCFVVNTGYTVPPGTPKNFNTLQTLFTQAGFSHNYFQANPVPPGPVSIK